MTKRRKYFPRRESRLGAAESAETARAEIEEAAMGGTLFAVAERTVDPGPTPAEGLTLDIAALRSDLEGERERTAALRRTLEEVHRAVQSRQEALAATARRIENLELRGREERAQERRKLRKLAPLGVLKLDDSLETDLKIRLFCEVISRRPLAELEAMFAS